MQLLNMAIKTNNYTATNGKIYTGYAIRLSRLMIVSRKAKKKQPYATNE